MDNIKANSGIFMKLEIIVIVKNKKKCLTFIAPTQFRTEN